MTRRGHSCREGSDTLSYFKLLQEVLLTQGETGIASFIYISSAQGKHSARVKWYPSAPKSRTSPCLSISVGGNPIIKNLNLPARIASSAETKVKLWVAMNHIALLDFWNNGYSWTHQQVGQFIARLIKV